MIKSIILMSGGLDSAVSLGLCRKSHNVKLALTFDYGQKAAQTEIDASKKLCEFYNVTHKVIKLDFLKEITHTLRLHNYWRKQRRSPHLPRQHKRIYRQG